MDLVQIRAALPLVLIVLDVICYLIFDVVFYLIFHVLLFLLLFTVLQYYHLVIILVKSNRTGNDTNHTQPHDGSCSVGRGIAKVVVVG